MIDLSLLFLNFVKLIDGFAVVLDTLFKQNLANYFLNFTAGGQGSD